MKGESVGYTVKSMDKEFPISNYPLEQTEFLYDSKLGTVDFILWLTQTVSRMLKWLKGLLKNGQKHEINSKMKLIVILIIQCSIIGRVNELPV